MNKPSPPAFSRKGIAVLMLTAVLLLAVRFVWPLMSRGPTQPQAIQGVLDLRGWNFHDNGVVKLNGEWSFVPNRFARAADSEQASFIPVPGFWNAYLHPDKPDPYGYGTYHLRVLLPRQNEAEPGLYAIHTIIVRMAYKLYVNDKLIGTRGDPGETHSSTTSEFLPNVAYATVNGSTADIVLHVANFDYGISGGIVLPIEFGAPDVMAAHLRQSEGLTIGFAVLLLLFTLLTGFLFVYQRTQTYLLYFALFCLSAALFLLTHDERLLLQAFPVISFNVAGKISMLSSVGLMYFCYMFIVRLYPKKNYKFPLWICRMASALFTLLYLCTDYHFFSAWENFLNVFFVTGIVYVVFLLVSAVLKHREDAPYLFLGGIAIISIALSYLLAFLGLPYSTTPGLDFPIFALSLVLLVARRYMQTFESNKILSEQRLRIEMAFLQAQIKPHFLLNSLNTIGSFIESDPYRAQNLLGEFSTYLRHSFDFANVRPFVPFEREWELVESYLQLEKARFGHRLEIDAEVDAAMGLQLPPVSLQPLVENAVRHGLMKRLGGGTIRITAVEHAADVEICVEDNGAGIPPERLAQLLAFSYPVQSASGATTGVGLLNIQNRLIHAYGKGLTIQSRPNQGTIVKFRIRKELIARDHTNSYTG